MTQKWCMLKPLQEFRAPPAPCYYEDCFKKYQDYGPKFPLVMVLRAVKIPQDDTGNYLSQAAYQWRTSATLQPLIWVAYGAVRSNLLLEDCPSWAALESMRELPKIRGPDIDPK